MTAPWSSLLDRPEFSLPPGQLESVVGGRTVVITGAGGTVGRELARLIQKGRPGKLILVDSHEASLVRLGPYLDVEACGSTERHFVLADVRDRPKLDQIFRRHDCDVVFHLAAYKQVPLAETNIDQVIAVNLVGTANVLDSATEHGIRCFAFPSTDKAVNPFGIYGVTKRLVERYLSARAATDSEPAIRIVRLVNVLGSQGSVAEIFARQIESGEPIGITDTRMDRYWMTMDEATRLLVAAAARPTYEGTYLLEVGEAVPMLETARKMYHRIVPGEGEPTIRIIGVRPGERLHEPLGYDNEVRKDTSTPGLYALHPPPLTISSDTWNQIVTELRQCLYALDPQDLRSWAFAAAIETTLPSFPRVRV